MPKQDEQTAWEDAFKSAQRAPAATSQQEPHWYATAFAIATGLVALWALFNWIPSS